MSVKSTFSSACTPGKALQILSILSMKSFAVDMLAYLFKTIILFGSGALKKHRFLLSCKIPD
jgi:hypothetical protein